MQGRATLISPLWLLLLLGCGETAVEPPGAAPCACCEPPAAESFDAAAAGSLRGRVVWEGPEPHVPAFTIYPDPLTPLDRRRVKRLPNPYAPRIDPADKGMADVVVFLRGVDPQKARPWHHAPVSVEWCEERLVVVQGNARSQSGFVRRGDEVEFVNRETAYHGVRGRGAAGFSLPLPEKHQPTVRRLGGVGVVELSGAAREFWTRAHLHVSEHPYYARTDAEGRFTLEQVPAGTYELVCRVPSWHVVRRERDPELAVVSRVAFARAVEQAVTVRVGAGRPAETRFAWDLARFPVPAAGQ